MLTSENDIGDYPLSAAIVSEYAPKKHRSAMLATLFFMQPLGQFVATVVAIIVTFCYRSSTQADLSYCKSTECFVAVDRAWRWIIGLGGLPALIAFVIRLQIPESPRYTMDVLLNTQKALEETTEYFEPENHNLLHTGNGHRSEGLAPNDIGIGTKKSASPTQLPGHFKEQSAANKGITASEDEIMAHPNDTLNPRRETRNLSIGETSGPSGQLHQNGRRGIYQIHHWWKGFMEYFTTQGNGIHLLGVCVCWFLLDISFYGLGMSSPTIIMELWNGHGNCPDIGSNQSVFALLYGNAWHSSIVVSLGALIGGVLMIYVVRHSRPVKVQSLFFVVLGIFLLIVGGTFQPFLNAKSTGDHWALVAFYFCCQIFFNLGPNATTFIVKPPKDRVLPEEKVNCS